MRLKRKHHRLTCNNKKLLILLTIRFLGVVVFRLRPLKYLVCLKVLKQLMEKLVLIKVYGYF